MGVSTQPELMQNPPSDLAFGEVRLALAHIVPADPVRDFVPYHHFRILLADSTDAGHINFRVGDTEHVRQFAGHIGFEVHEAFRGSGLALQACRAIAPFVRTFYEAVIITCDPDNMASSRTIEKLGATFIDEVAVPPAVSHSKETMRIKRRYRWVP
jgi:predicted acetyltransferase